jgi:hypothetical protein
MAQKHTAEGIVERLANRLSTDLGSSRLSFHVCGDWHEFSLFIDDGIRVTASFWTRFLDDEKGGTA